MITRRNLIWLIAGRIAVSSAVLGVGSAVDVAPLAFAGTHAVLLALVIIYLLASIQLLLALVNTAYEPQLKFQIAGDLIVITGLIFLSGEVRSPYSSLYLIVIAYAALMAGRINGYAAAAASTIFYVGIIDLAHFGVIPFPPLEMSFESLNFEIAIVVLGFLTVSVLSATLSERLKRVREELEEKSGSLADLRVFNENIVESLRSGLVTTDLEGNIRTANRSAEGLSEIALHHLIGKPLQVLLSEEFVAQLLTEDVQLRREPLRHECWYTTDHGHRKYLGFSISPLFNNARDLVGYIVSFQDLTEIKRLQEEVAIKDKLAAVGHLAAAIAHEIRNPLASMHGSIQMLQRTLDLTSQDLRLMDIVLRESNRLNKIIEDFLSYARPRQVELVALNLAELIEETVALLKNHPSFKKDHEIVVSDDGQAARIMGDADLMRQVCWNLASNSLKAMPAGGKLAIESRSDGDGRVRIRFVDEGIGMSQAELDLMFQPFHSGFSDGLGIGMAIVYQIVTQHGGRIQVQSRSGTGTSIELEFAAS